MKQFYLSLIAFFTWVIGMAQSGGDSTRLPLTDSIQAKKSTFTIGAVYANDASYYGQRSDERLPYVALAAAYHHRSGFYLTGMGYRLLNDSARLASAYSLGAGFSFPLGKSFTADLSYDYSIYPKFSPFLQAANPHSVNLTIARESVVDLSISGDYAFGKTNDFFITPQISRDIDLFNIGRNDLVSFNPSLDMTAGTQHFYEYYQEEKGIRDSILGILMPPVLGGSPSEQNPTIKTTNRFEILSYNLKLPVSYNRNHLKLEVSGQFSLLSKQAQSQPGKVNSFFSAAFYYQF
ncbi:hypothetical protein U0035_00850 [Niabella yanshanensis]|uniref:Uncharacterized protein n=1 Tax=Niabella yanshanensis TaxID=577386 RepID=A0ABZ0W600_9BACT|nr:hypothetical protein [Niabella yanshanensis]WQD38690.1 hypothetical protein U0035_00850 [Niabella yanshanensis]